MKLPGLFLFICLFLISQSSAKIINVPADYPKIQSAIDASSDGDTVLVSIGVYYENIKFNGKRIVVASNYIYDHNPNTITETIIDGGHSTDPNFQSCVMIVSGEDSTTVLEGFTLTHGKGSKWVDEHGAGTYREGGGILIAVSSPVIKHNFIINNEAIDSKGFNSAGGGGIRAGDGNPKILNNIIMRNKGLYGGGVVLNYTGGIIRNNIIYQNSGGQGYGGAGIWCNSPSVKGDKIYIENNTIVNNFCYTDGGGLLIWETNVTARNNIFWGNWSSTKEKSAISLRSGGTITSSYSDVQTEVSGEGNMKSDPLLDFNNVLQLLANSPCIDAGNPDQSYYDKEDLLKPGYALSPSMGMLRNDIGAYGGKDRCEFPKWTFVARIGIDKNALDFLRVTVGDSSSVKLPVYNFGELPGRIDSIRISKNPENFSCFNNYPFVINPSVSDSLTLWWKPAKTGFLKDTLYIYHNDSTLTNPVKVKLTGVGAATTGIDESYNIPELFALYQNYPNPFNPSTKIRYSIPIPSISSFYRRGNKGGIVTLKVYDVLGNEVATLVNKEQHPGNYEVEFNSSLYSGLSSGMYFYVLRVVDKTIVNKMLLIK